MNFIIWAVIFLIAFSDQVSKFFISQNLDLNESVPVVRDIFHLTLVHNTGAAFGIFKNETLLFIAISFLAIILIVIFMRKKRDLFFPRDIALSLVLGGALGNLIDRLRFGYVVDFLDLRIWPVFNIADSAITIGTILMIISLCIRSSSK